jgi:hypothetical protein
VGCAANSRRTARARSRRFRTHRVALPARPAAETVTDLAHIYRESLGPVRIQHANVVTRRAGDDLVDALPRTYQPVSSDWLRGSRPCALLSRHVSVRTPGLGSPCTQDLESLLTITAGEFIDRHGKLLCHRSALWSYAHEQHPSSQTRVRAADVQTLQPEVARDALCFAKLR